MVRFGLFSYCFHFCLFEFLFAFLFVFLFVCLFLKYIVTRKKEERLPFLYFVTSAEKFFLSFLGDEPL